MATEQTLFFTCPSCEERFCRVEELDRDLHTGEIYHCGECGIQVIFTAVTAEDYVPPPRARNGTAPTAALVPQLLHIHGDRYSQKGGTT